MALQDQPWGVEGSRATRTSNVRGNLNASPTGRNLLAGIDVMYKFAADPTSEPPSFPDGDRGFYVDGANLVFVLYDRETGWVKTVMVP